MCSSEHVPCLVVSIKISTDDASVGRGLSFQDWLSYMGIDGGVREHVDIIDDKLLPAVAATAMYRIETLC